MSGIPIISAPSVSLSRSEQKVSIASPISVGVSEPRFLSQRSAPDLSLKSISTPTININSAITNPSSLNLSGIGSSIGIPTTIAGAVSATTGFSSVGQVANAFGVPTTIAGAAAAVGLPTGLPPLGQAFNTLGVPTSFTGLVNLSGLQFPKIPAFPGIDLVGINLGAGPKFIAEQIAKYKMIVPPFVPGLKINMGMALAAISVLRAAMQVGPGELVKHLLSNIVDDLKQDLISQVNQQLNNSLTPPDGQNIQIQLGGVVDGAKNSFVDQFNRDNPPQTITNDDGETITIPAPTPDLSSFPSTDILPKSGQGVLSQTNINTSEFSSTAGSNLKAFTFPPNG